MGCVQHVEIVLTAHPTQVHRRTLQYKHNRIVSLLAENDRHGPRKLIQLTHVFGVHDSGI